MTKILAVILLLVPVVASAQTMSGAFISGGAANVAAVGSTTLLFLDFEETSETNCDKSTVANPPDNAGTADCDYSAEVLSGSHTGAFLGLADAGERTMEWTNDFDCTAGVCRITALMQVTADTDGSAGTLISFGDLNTFDALDANFDATTDLITAKCADASSGTTAITVGTTYKFCMEYDLSADTGRLRMDTTGNDMCAGLAVDLSCSNSGTDRTGVSQMTLRGKISQWDLLVDDLTMLSIP